MLIATLPLAALGLYFVGSAILDYHRIGQFDDWWSRGKHVDRFGFDRARSLLRTPGLWSLEKRLSPESSRVPALRLLVDASEFERVSSDVGRHWGEELKAEALEGGELHEVSLRLRGDTSVHWTTAKKSLTLKSGRGELFKGFRTLGFSCKDVLPAWLANSLSPEFDVLNATTSVVPIYLNERFYGLFRFIEPLDESYLRRHVLLPGNIYRGDAAERGEYFKGVERELFKNLYIWDRAAKNDRPGSTGTAALGWFFQDLNGTTFAEHREMLAWFDERELARLFALMLAVGDPFHMSGVHNQFWYEEPSSGLLHPIAWDLRLLDLDRPPPDSRYNRFLQELLRDPRVFDRALAELAEQLRGQRLMNRARGLVRSVEERYGDMIAYDQLREGLIPPIGDTDECLSLLARNLSRIASWIGDARVAYCATPEESPTTFDFEVRGMAGVELIGFEVQGDGSWFELVTFRGMPADSNLDGEWSGEDRQVPVIHDEGHTGRILLSQPELLLPGVVCDGGKLEPESVHYRYFLPEFGPGGRVTPLLRNRHTGEPVTAEPWAAGSAIRETRSFHPWRYTSPEPANVELSGEMHLTETLVVPAGSTLTIAPGTHLRLDPDVSILCKGKALALGTPEAPIVIENSVERRPWDTLALQGAGANDSLFRHARIQGGGGGLLERVEYTAMVCVHDAYEVRFEDCEFGPNLRCDDQVHADRADLYLVRCNLFDANGDAIDYDMSGGEVRECRIERTVNDGLDFMTCWPRVIGNTIANCGDKGISIGEASMPLVFDNRIENCNRGIEVKDTSKPWIVHTRVQGCKTGLRERLKNWRYGAGGWGKLIDTELVDNQKVLELEPDTRLSLLGTVLGGAQAEEPVAVVDASWLLAQYGIEVAEPRLGPVESWRAIAPIAPLDRQVFREDFETVSAGWIHGQGVRELAVRGEELVARIGRGDARIGKRVDWDLTDPARRYVLALEIAAEDLASAELYVERGQESERAQLDVSGTAERFQIAVLELPPGRYDGLVLDARAHTGPESPASRLRLHSYTLMALPRAAGGR